MSRKLLFQRFMYEIIHKAKQEVARDKFSLISFMYTYFSKSFLYRFFLSSFILEIIFPYERDSRIFSIHNDALDLIY